MSITIGDIVVDFSSQVKNIGVIFDRVLSLRQYVCESGYLCELVVPYVPLRVLRSAELNLLTVPSGKPGKYGSPCFARASVNLWNSLRGERDAWLKNSPILESFKRNLKRFSSGNGSRVKQCYFLFQCLSLYFACIIVCYTCDIVCVDYSSALEYSIIRRYTNIVYYYYYYYRYLSNSVSSLPFTP